MPNNNVAGPNNVTGLGLCLKTQPDLTGFLFQGSQTDCTFTNVTFDSQDSFNKGWFDSASATNSPSVTFDGCTFKNTGDHEMATGTSYVGCNFENCGEVNLGGGIASGCVFLRNQAVIGSISNIDNCSFTAMDIGTDDTYAHPVWGYIDFEGTPAEWYDKGPGGRSDWLIPANVQTGTNSNQPGGTTHRITPSTGSQTLRFATGPENWAVGTGTDNMHPATMEAWIYGNGQLPNNTYLNLTSRGVNWNSSQNFSWFVRGNGVTDQAVIEIYFGYNFSLIFLDFDPGPWNANGMNHIAVCRNEIGDWGAFLNGTACGSTTGGGLWNEFGTAPFYIGPGPGLSFTSENYEYEIDQIRYSGRCVYPLNVSFTPSPILSPTGAAHAIICDDPPGSYTLDALSFTGYGANGSNSSAIRFTATSGVININVIGGSIPTYTSDGATINFTLSTTLTLTGIEPGTEVRVYEAGTTNEVAGVESTITGTEAFGISTSAVDIVIHSLGELHKRIKNVDTSTNRNIPIQQFLDRQYENP
jgi:hypothetical protein